MSIRIGIYGYGNLGRGVECAVKYNPDTELFGIFTRRAPDSVKTLTGAPVFSANDILNYKSDYHSTKIGIICYNYSCEWCISLLNSTHGALFMSRCLISLHSEIDISSNNIKKLHINIDENIKSVYENKFKDEINKCSVATNHFINLPIEQFRTKISYYEKILRESRLMIEARARIEATTITMMAE